MNIHEDFQFSTWSHPHCSVSIEYPAHWTVRPDPEPGLDVTFLSPPDDDVSLEVHFLPFLIPVTIFQSEQDLLETLERMVLQNSDAEVLGRSNVLPYPTIAGRLNDGTLIWVTMHLDRLVVLQTAGDPGQRERFQPVFERMLQSFRIHATRQSEIGVLLGEVIKAITTVAPDASPKLSRDYVELGTMQIRADNLAANIRNAPQHKQRLIREFVQTTVQTWRSLSKIADVSWDSVRRSVYPMVRPASILQQGIPADMDHRPLSEADRVRQRMLSTPWLANLVICYAIDSEKTLRFVLNHDLERWGLDAAVVQKQAMRNLAKAKGPRFNIQRDDYGKMMIAEIVGNGLPSRSCWILHPALHQAVQSVCRGPAWAAMPSRDCMMVFPAAPHLRSSMQQFLNHEFCTTGHPLSDRLFAVKADGVVLA